jgi:hypothetical protein
MLPHARALLGAVLTAAVLVSAGCGSSSSKDDNSPTTAAKAAKPAATTPAAPAPATAPATQDSTPKAVPTKAAYVRAADKVCRQVHAVSKSANSVVQKAFAANDLNRAAEAIDNYTPMFAQRVAQLEALPRPKGADDAKLIAGLMKVMDGQVQALHDEAAALRSQDNATLQQISKAQQTELQFADTLGRQYGFKVCGLAA